MSTVREQILSAVTVNLATVTSAAGGVFRSRVFALTRAQRPCIAIEPTSDTPDPSTLGVIFWSLLLRVAVIVGGDIPDQVADPIVKDVHGAMISDRTLGGLSMDIEPVSVNFDLIDGDQPIGVISLVYKIDYRTSAEDLSVLL